MPTTTTGKTPSELVLSRRIRTRIDLIRPDATTPVEISPLQKRIDKYETKMSISTLDAKVFEAFNWAKMC